MNYNMADLIFWGALILCGIIMLIYYATSKHPVKNATAGMFLGGLALSLIHFFGASIGLYISLNVFTTLVSLILGLPGAILLIVGSLVI